MNVLVTYATKHGATAEIAERIAQTLTEYDISTELLPVTAEIDLSNYSTVILGSAVYMGAWRKEAVRFLQNNEQLLQERHVWLFSSGPTGEGDPNELLKDWQFPKQIKGSIDRIQPEEIAVFHGELDPGELNLFERFVIRNVKAPTGDFRDWEMIQEWTKGIVHRLAQLA